jgi:hypothetical protein
VPFVTRLCLALLLTLLAAAASAQDLIANDPLDRGESLDKVSAPHGVVEPRASASDESLCLLVNTAARANGLPVEFFTRLIWEESRLRPDVIGPRTRSGDRARGIAQFMPRTAQERRLLDPFDPGQALPKSAEFLRELRDKFGNVGLAAAAYNAGPRRVRDWIAGRQPIPAQTRHYVSAVTGRSIDTWRSARNVGPVRERQALDCPKLIALSSQSFPRFVRGDLGDLGDAKARQKPDSLASAQQPDPSATAETHQLTSAEPVQLVSARQSNQLVDASIRRVEAGVASPRWGMQLTAGFTESEAWTSYRSIQQRYAELIGDREPIVVPRRNLSFGNAMRYNIRVVDDDRIGLEQLCAKVLSAGGACLVLRND